MSLVTLDINEVADVIDEAITRHVLVSHNNNKANGFVNDILSFRGELQKLDEYVRGLNYNSDIESVKTEISKLDEKLSGFGELIDDIFKRENDINTKLINYVTVEQIHSISQEIETIKDNIKERHVDVTKGMEIELSSLNEKLYSFQEIIISIDKRFDDYVTTKESLLVSQEIKEVKDDIQEYVLEEIGGARLSLESLIKQEIDKLPAPTTVDFDEVKSFVVDEISKIFVPENGTSVTIDDVLPFIKEEIKKEIKNIPVPKNGTSVTIDDVLPSIKEFVSQAVLELPKPEDGKSVDLDLILNYIQTEIVKIKPRDGIDGKNGASIEDIENVIKTIVEKTISEIPRPRDGLDGINITLDDIRPIVLEAVNAIPLPKDGIGMTGAIIDRNGELYLTCTDGSTKSLGVVVGRDGAGVSLDEVKTLVEECLPKDNLSVDDVKKIIESSSNVVPFPREEIRSVVKSELDSLPKPDILSVDDILPIVENSINKRILDVSKEITQDAIVDDARLETMIGTFVASYLDKKSIEIPVPSVVHIEEAAPEDIAEKIAKAISIVAESPFVQQYQQQQPIVVNVTNPAPVQSLSSGKRITTRRDENGNIIAEVTSVDKTMTIRKNKDGTINSEES